MPKEKYQFKKASYLEKIPYVHGLPHAGRAGKAEQQFVRRNLQSVNVRRLQEGLPPIDPTNPQDAKRYGFPKPT